MPSNVRIGVIGAGSMGRLHACNAARHVAGVEIVAVADPDTVRAEQLAEQLGGVRAYVDGGELIDDRRVDAVVIASPLPTHSQWLRACAHAGKDAFCEKPLAVSVDEAVRTVEAIRVSGIRVQVGFNRRFDAPYVHAKATIESGRIGEPVIFKALTRDRLPPSTEYLQATEGAGMLVDTAVHDYDLARWLMSDEVAQVHAVGGVLVAHDIGELQGPDAVSVNLRFVRDSIGNVETFRGARYGDDVRTEVVGSKGSLVIGQTARLPVQVLTDDGLHHEGYPDHFDRFGDSYVGELAAFVEAIAEDRSVEVDEGDGLRAVEIAVAARRSLDAGSLVDLPLA
jgi:scyllo-inositol 2-dehydrogenase (NAD+)